jgi:hypothetical protein
MPRVAYSGQPKGMLKEDGYTMTMRVTYAVGRLYWARRARWRGRSREDPARGSVSWRAIESGHLMVAVQGTLHT